MPEAPRYPRRLIEVDLPIRRISAHARREKSIRHSHISTLHIWWARRPLAACRAVLCAALWPDPVDTLCPGSFRLAAKREMLAWATKHRKLLSAESYTRFNSIAREPGLLDDPAVLRTALLDFIADFSNWDSSTVREYLDTSRALTRAAYEAPGGGEPTPPLVADPFAGGGAIPLEALRVGATVFASDLNPVALLLNKVALEYIPRYGQRLADETRKWGAWIKEEAERELGVLYPPDPDGAHPIAYIWARTILCEGPECGAEVPLIKSLWLGKKPHNSWALRIVTKTKPHRVEFQIVQGAKPGEIGPGTTRRGAASCPCCGYSTPVSSIRKQLAAKDGGASTARLICVVTKRPGEQGRFYRLPTLHDIVAVKKAEALLESRVTSNKGQYSVVPDESLPAQGTLGFRVQLYGVKQWGHLFSHRQALLLVVLAEKVREVRNHLTSVDDPGFAEAVQVLLALNVDKMADYGSSLASWSSPASQETVRGTFSRQALAMVWDFAEAYPFVSSSGGWLHNLGFLTSPVEAESNSALTPGTIASASATRHPLPDGCVDAFVTDPPYYDAIPYADLSDFFIVWLKRSLAGSQAGRAFETLSNKDEECVVDATKGHDGAYFSRTMEKALSEGRRITRPEGIGVVVFAHKSTAGWEAQLQAMINAGWVITGSWPIDTERAGRVRANSSAALASSVHLVCRPRDRSSDSDIAERVGDWREVLRELPIRIHEWMPRLSEEGVVGADAIFACLGPALEVFSRYNRVEKTSGDAVSLAEYLEHVWAAVSKEALSMIFRDAETVGLESDARLTAMWLWTLAGPAGGDDVDGGVAPSDEDGDDVDGGAGPSSGGAFSLEYDAARKIAQGLGARLEELTTVVEVKGEKARLLTVAERAKALFQRADGAALGTTHKAPRKKQLKLFEEEIESAAEEQGWDASGAPFVGKTTLDRIHQAMLLFGAGRSDALKRFLVQEGAGQQASFWKLAQALSALYPSGCDEKRWVDGVLGRKKGLGF